MIDLRHLRYFVAVSEELHFGPAAERLHITQPPLSQAIRALEDELGVVLLHRTSRAVGLTAAGRVFAEEARNILAAVGSAIAETRRVGGERSGMHLGCIPELPIDLLLAFLEAMEERDPAARANVTHLTGPEQIQRLLSGELDLGLFQYAGEHAELEQQPLFAGELLVAYLPLGHPLARRELLDPAALRDEVLIVFRRAANPPLYDRVQALIADGGFSFRGIHEAGGATARDIMLAVAAGRGVGLAPFSFKETSDVGTIVARRELLPPVVLPDTVVAWVAEPRPQLRQLIAAARDAASELRRLGDANASSQLTRRRSKRPGAGKDGGGPP